MSMPIEVRDFILKWAEDNERNCQCESHKRDGRLPNHMIKQVTNCFRNPGQFSMIMGIVEMMCAHHPPLLHLLNEGIAEILEKERMN
jgi:hypothetical protein